MRCGTPPATARPISAGTPSARRWPGSMARRCSIGCATERGRCGDARLPRPAAGRRRRASGGCASASKGSSDVARIRAARRLKETSDAARPRRAHDGVRYSRPVRLTRHRLMLRPRDSHDLRLIDATLGLSPPAAKMRWAHDVQSNSVLSSFRRGGDRPAAHRLDAGAAALPADRPAAGDRGARCSRSATRSRKCPTWRG